MRGLERAGERSREVERHIPRELRECAGFTTAGVREQEQRGVQREREKCGHEGMGGVGMTE